ncbi:MULTISPECIES: OmpA family protein [Uliginosibacterium]|uniref:OmpA family protein n=1 Tax=Uliginosibacterium aquaticum TaxID=2731212 RepID=A0ABX2ILJ1_9RHOO|nr:MULTISPECIES: OmpA family protein [Uliginosibacterium]MDO6385545.1 OmpA family protein [Uliginosibacterium sp. 31-12]NSL56758.1 OmpA family protein [Uliginosibacterium aquaticum]
MEKDEQIGLVVLIGGLVLACVLAVISFGVYTTSPGYRNVSVKTQAGIPQGEPVARIYFNLGSDELPEEAGGAIQTLKEKIAANPKAQVLISGFHDPSGDPVKNAELAKERAMATQKALIGVGVPAERIVLRKPEQLTDTADMQEARRVDIHLQ